MSELHGILDVESVGLHGEGFAAALTIIDSDRGIIATGYFGCPSDTAQGADEDRTWIEENVIPYLPAPNCENPSEVRNSLWDYYIEWKAKSKTEGKTFTLWADCGFPVETRFVAACIDEDVRDRGWEGPYPLQEIATVRTTLGLDPTLSYDLPETEQHNPVTETAYVAKKLVEWLEVARAKLAN